MARITITKAFANNPLALPRLSCPAMVIESVAVTVTVPPRLAPAKVLLSITAPCVRVNVVYPDVSSTALHECSSPNQRTIHVQAPSRNLDIPRVSCTNAPRCNESPRV